MEILSLAAVSRHRLQAQAARHLTVVLENRFFIFKVQPGAATYQRTSNESDDSLQFKRLYYNTTLCRNRVVRPSLESLAPVEGCGVRDYDAVLHTVT